MQARPPPGERYIPPTAPGIPVQAMQNLIPRLATTINDIDGLKNQIAAGNMDGSMPNWDTLLQRYSMLLGRVQQLSAYIAQEARKAPGGLPPLPGTAGAVRPPPGAAGSSAATANAGPSTPGVDKPAAPPVLSEYLVHALRPLPADAGPEAPDVLFQVINTMQIPQLDESQRALLADSSSQQSVLSLPGQVKLLPLEDLHKLDDTALVRLTADMRARLKREHHRATALIKEIQTREDEYDWAFRITEDDDDDEKDDLFDDDEDGDGDQDVKMKPPVEEKIPNPREGWKVADYLKFLDTGDVPPPPPPAADAPVGGPGSAMVVG